MKSRSEVSSFIDQKYLVLEKSIRNHGCHSLKVEEFNNLGIRRIIISKTKRKGVCLEFWSSEKQSEFLAEKMSITQGSKSSSHGVWAFIETLEEAETILQNALQYSAALSQQETEEIDKEYDRSEIEESALSKMDNVDRAKYEGFWEISKKLNSHLGSIFHVDHAMSIKQGRESAITYNNLQILVKGINTSKNDSSWNRFTYEQQKSHIINCAQVIPDTDISYINFLIEQLKFYWD